VATGHQVQDIAGQKNYPTSLPSTILRVLTIASLILNVIRFSCGV
jgi:hypothetical protein